MFLSQAHQQTLSPPSLARAIVVSNQDPDQLGRVQVRYPWADPKSQNSSSQWARVLSPFASNHSGWVSLPHPNDEVFVYFENGNLDLPIILGTLYSKKNPPPNFQNSKDHPGKNCILKTSGGHTLFIDDTSETQGIVLQTGSGKSITLSDGKKEIRIEDENQNKIQVQQKAETSSITGQKL